jgi:hypothetical protein
MRVVIDVFTALPIFVSHPFPFFPLLVMDVSMVLMFVREDSRVGCDHRDRN